MSRIPKEFKVRIPEDRTAQYPTDERDSSRLLVVDRRQEKVCDAGLFREIKNLIAGDLIVVNNTRVVPARVEGFRPGGGRVELLFIVKPEFSPQEKCELAALISPGRRLRPGMTLRLSANAAFLLKEKDTSGRWLGLWSCGEDKAPFWSWLENAGMMPLPPYIRRAPEDIDTVRYQTSYASNDGSLAAPTAGLHFTQDLIAELEKAGCEFAGLTLDVGLGTFLPIRSDDLSSHEMHEERYEIPELTVNKISRARESGRRITVVGTTVVRALEDGVKGGLPLTPGERTANLFIYPPYRFKLIDRLLTNFHRPDSTLLQLVAAFIGWDLLNEAYQTALDLDFRFYSYGDAMLIV